jgi:uncharacterized protein YigE (DUF2233 family)
MSGMRALLLGWMVAGVALASGVTEELVAHAGVRFRVVRLEARQVELVWRDAAGRPFATFDKVQAHYAAAGKRVKFLINAGIYEPGGVPSGLHHERGLRLRPLNPRDGVGNFYLKPNGVFAWTGGGAGRAFIEESGAFARREKRAPARLEFAIQGGPLLLSGGLRHPAFRAGSASKLLRNGVGVDAGGKVVFAITAPGELVNFWDFAGLFLQLGCRDALFLDGDISQMAVDPEGPVASNRFGAMFVVAE